MLGTWKLSMNFSYFVTLKSIWSYTWTNLLSKCDLVTSCIGDLENVDSLSYVGFPSVDTVCFTVRNTEVMATDLIRKVFNCWEAVKLEKAYTCSQNSNFTWNFKFDHWQLRLSIVFLKVTGSVCSSWKKYLPNT